MNDFTKEELEYIANDIEAEFSEHSQYRTDKPVSQGWAILDKIQFMIDNYCEIKTPTIANYCCQKCNEEWHKCDCKDRVKDE